MRYESYDTLTIRRVFAAGMYSARGEDDIAIQWLYKGQGDFFAITNYVDMFL